MMLPICHSKELLIHEDGIVEFYPGAIGETTELMRSILESSQFMQNFIMMWGKTHPVPRLECWHGEASYTYSGIRLNPRPWYQSLRELKGKVEELSGTRFNSCLINYYRDGHDYLNFHCDDEPELGPNPIIASVSLGAGRRFVLRRIDDHDVKKEILLCDGDLLVMKGSLQAHWQHALPKMLRVKEPRINITFRTINEEMT